MRRFWIAPLLFVAGAAQATPVTVSDYANAMSEIAQRLEIQLADRQKVGEAAAAQRLALAAAMIRRTGAEFRGGEQQALLDATDTLPPPIKAKLDVAFARAQDAESRAGDQPSYIDEAHAAFNALIDALPFKTPHPTIYGLLSNDLAEPTAKLPADVVVYGDRLIDPFYKTAPTVAYAGSELPAADVRATGDRIEITLPPDVKAAVHFAPPACEQRPSFGLRVRAIYAQTKGFFWPLNWHTSVDTSIDLFSLASPVLFEARIAAQVEAPATSATTVPFKRRSEYVVADCEQTKAVEVSISLPEDRSDVVCQAAWVDTTGHSETSGRCQERVGSVSASGALTGPAKICSPDKLCACSSNGQGYLEISGSYRISQAASGVRSLAQEAPLAFPLGGLAQRSFAERLRLLRIEVARRACPVVADTLTLSLGEEADAAGVAVSRTGAFRAVFEDGRLKVGSASAFDP